jgi:transcriptional regulatory protein GAL4
LEEALQQHRESKMYSSNAASGHDEQALSHVRPTQTGEGIADYEWNEVSDPEAREQSSDSDHARDGMAALTSRNQGSGYLGEAKYIISA